MRSLLAIDIGGTKSHLGLFSLENWSGSAYDEKIYKNADYSGIVEILAQFLQDRSAEIDSVSIAVAGVIEGDTATMTNISWTISCEELKDHFGFPDIVLVNDLAALATSVPFLQPDDIIEIQLGSEVDGGTIAVIAPGTGLGQGFLVYNDGKYIVKGSEGGHSGFTPTNAEEVELLKWLMARNETLSAELLCAGPGISLLFEFYKQMSKIEPASWVVKEIRQGFDITAVVVKGATVEDDTCSLCRQTIDLYLRLLGSEAGNLALKLFSRGGLFIGGGVVPRLVGKVSFAPFLQAFRKKGKMEKLMTSVPVRIILKKDAILCGTAEHGRKHR